MSHYVGVDFFDYRNRIDERAVQIEKRGGDVAEVNFLFHGLIIHQKTILHFFFVVYCKQVKHTEEKQPWRVRSSFIVAVLLVCNLAFVALLVANFTSSTVLAIGYVDKSTWLSEDISFAEWGSSATDGGWRGINGGDETVQGVGTQDNPITIGSARELARLAYLVGDGRDFANTYFQLANDIDLRAREWIPVGSNFSGYLNKEDFKLFEQGSPNTRLNKSCEVFGVTLGVKEMELTEGDSIPEPTAVPCNVEFVGWAVNPYLKRVGSVQFPVGAAIDDSMPLILHAVYKFISPIELTINGGDDILVTSQVSTHKVYSPNGYANFLGSRHSLSGLHIGWARTLQDARRGTVHYTTQNGVNIYRFTENTQLFAVWCAEGMGFEYYNPWGDEPQPMLLPSPTPSIVGSGLLMWDSIHGASAYRIYINQGHWATISYNFIDLSFFFIGQYRIRVRAVGGLGYLDSSNSPEIVFRVGGSTEETSPPAPPSTQQAPLSVEIQTVSDVLATWNSTENSVGYIVYINGKPVATTYDNFIEFDELDLTAGLQILSVRTENSGLSAGAVFYVQDNGLAYLTGTNRWWQNYIFMAAMCFLLIMISVICVAVLIRRKRRSA